MRVQRCKIINDKVHVHDKKTRLWTLNIGQYPMVSTDPAEINQSIFECPNNPGSKDVHIVFVDNKFGLLEGR